MSRSTWEIYSSVLLCASKWNLSAADATAIAKKLENIGFLNHHVETSEINATEFPFFTDLTWKLYREARL